MEIPDIFLVVFTTILVLLITLVIKFFLDSRKIHNDFNSRLLTIEFELKRIRRLDPYIDFIVEEIRQKQILGIRLIIAKEHENEWENLNE
jgi:hypothetical protein